MKILALDQSTRITGFAIYDNGSLVKSGKFTLDGEMGIRLNNFRNKIINIIQENQIEFVAFEDIQLQDNKGPNNVVTYKKLAEVIGIMEQLCIELNLPYQIIHSQTWKSFLNIKGKDSATQKRNAQQFVLEKFGKKAPQDECDAICLGLCAVSENESAF